MAGPTRQGRSVLKKSAKTAASAMQSLLRRQDFLAAATGLSRASTGAVVQIRNRRDMAPPRAGFTVTKKLGAAVKRNRIRRRLKEAVRIAAGDCMRSGFDYVFVGRAGTAGREFSKLIADILTALDYLHHAHDRAARAAGSEVGGKPGPQDHR